MALRIMFSRNDDSLALEALRLSLRKQTINWEKLYEDYLTELIELRGCVGTFKEKAIYSPSAMGSVLLAYFEEMGKKPYVIENHIKRSWDKLPLHHG